MTEAGHAIDPNSTRAVREWSPTHLVWAAWTIPEHVRKWYAEALRDGRVRDRSSPGRNLPRRDALAGGPAHGRRCGLRPRVVENRRFVDGGAGPGFRPAASDSPSPPSTMEPAGSGTGTGLSPCTADRDEDRARSWLPRVGRGSRQLVAMAKSPGTSRRCPETRASPAVMGREAGWL
jgi:hypothetical protein